MRTLTRLAQLGLAAALLSACQTQAPRRSSLPPVSQAPTVEGNWADPNGLVSTFSAGTFTTRTTDGSNALMASGSSSVAPDVVIQIAFFSTLKKTNSRANCVLSGPNQLNCTSGTGAQFSLARTTSGPIGGPGPMASAAPASAPQGY